jgi:hypothetical protein
VGVTGRIAPSTDADIKVGYLHWNFLNTDTKPFSGLAVTAKVGHVFNRRTQATLELGHVPLQASGQVTGYYVRTDGTLGIERTLTQQTYVRAAITARRYDYSGATGQSPFSFIDYIGDVQLRYRPGQADRPGPLLLTLAYAPFARTSNEANLEYHSQRVSIALLYGWF